jgi:hypothetical protein
MNASYKEPRASCGRQAEGAVRGLTPKATLFVHRIDMANFMRILNNSWYDFDLPVMRLGEIVLGAADLPAGGERLNRRGVLIVAAASNDAIDPKRDGPTFYPWAWYGLDHGSQRVVRVLRRQYLDRDFAPETRVAPAVDDPHAALPEAGRQLVRPETRASREGHRPPNARAR